MDSFGRRQQNPSSAWARGGKLPERGKMRVVAHNGKQLYQWDQTDKQIFIEIMAPPPNSSVFCNITENYVQLGAQTPGYPTTWYLNHDTWGPVKKGESYWKNGKETCKIVLAKAHPGIHWRYALKDDRDDARREQQKSRLPAATLRPAQSREQGQIPVVRQQQQRVPTANSRSPSPGRRKSRTARQDPPTALKYGRSTLPPLGLARPQQQKQQELRQSTAARSASPGRRKSRPVAAKPSLPVRAKSTGSLLSPLKSAELQKTITRDPLPGRRKSTLDKESTLALPVKAKPMSALVSPSKRGQSRSPERRNERQTKTQPSLNPKSTSLPHSKLSRSPSAGRQRSGKENVLSSKKEKSTSFLDRFKESKEGQQEGQRPTVSSPSTQAYRKLSLDKEKSDLPVRAKKPTVSFRSPPMDYRKGQQKNESRALSSSSPDRRNIRLAMDDSSIPVKTPPIEYRQGQQNKQIPKSSRPSSLGERIAKPTKADSLSPVKTRSSSFLSPLAAIRHQNEVEQQIPIEDKSHQPITRPRSPSPERRRATASKTDPPSKAHNSKSNNMTGPIVPQPTEIRSIGRGKPRSPSAVGPISAEKQTTHFDLVYMQKLQKEKEEELKSREEEAQQLNKKINKLEDIIATYRHQDKARKRRNKDMALTVDDLEDQLKQSKSEHLRQLSRLERSNRRVTAELEKQTALVQQMEKELGNTETKMEKQRRLAQSQAREIKDRESWIESLQSQLRKIKQREDTPEHDQIMAELQSQIHRVKIMKLGMKEYKRRWNEQRQFSDMQTQQITEKQSFVNSLTAKLEISNRRALELESERNRDQVDIIDTRRALAESQRHLEQLRQEHKQAIEKIRILESELRQQWQDWDEMEENMAWLSRNYDISDQFQFQESLANKAIRELIESRPDGNAQQRIQQLESELDEQQQDWKELEEALDFAQTKVASMEQQLNSKKLSDYIIPDTPRASVNDYLGRLAQKMVSTRNQIEEVQRRANMVTAK